MDPHSIPVGTKFDGDSRELLASEAWTSYAIDPSPPTLNRLLAFSEVKSLRAALLPALAGLFASTANWKTAQHLARECIDQRYPSLGLYYARRALELSGGNVIPRMTVVRAFWEQRFCEAALYHADVARSEVEGLPTERRVAFETELADLYTNIYIYLRDTARALPWLRILLRTSPIRGDTLCLALTAFCQDGEQTLAAEVALKLAPHLSDLAGRHAGMVRQVLRRRMLDVLATRPL